MKNVLFASGIDFVRGKEIKNLQIAFTYGRHLELERIDYKALSSRTVLDQLSQVCWLDMSNVCINCF